MDSGLYETAWKACENQAENWYWNLVPRPISTLCSPVRRSPMELDRDIGMALSIHESFHLFVHQPSYIHTYDFLDVSMQTIHLIDFKLLDEFIVWGPWFY